MSFLFKGNFKNRLGTNFINDYLGINLYDFLFKKIFYLDSKFYQKIENHSKIQGNEKILDIGSGTSSFSIYLKKKYPSIEVHNTDGSSKMISIARKKIQKQNLDISLKQALVENLPYEDESFDTVFAILLFSYIPKTIKPFALKELNRVLKKDGNLIIVDIAKQSGYKKYVNSLKYIPNGFFTEEGLKGEYIKMLHKSKFKDIRTYPINDKFIDLSLISSHK